MNPEDVIYLRDLYDKAKDILSKNDVPDSMVDARLLLEYCFGLKPMDLILYPDKTCDYEQAVRYMKMVQKRATRYPLQYITGIQEFMGLEFKVNESVLIPRQDTEILVENVIKFCNNKSVLDMCTGSGCIIVSIGRYASARKLTAVDISLEALDVARYNANFNEVSVDFIQSDLFENVSEKFDVIVSNPPYIPKSVIKGLMPEVRDYEPHLALEADNKGLYFYELIAKQAHNYLNENGIIAFEIGYEQAEDVSNILCDNRFYDIKVIKDYASHDRVVMACI